MRALQVRKYDERTRKRYTTVELIEEEVEWSIEGSGAAREQTGLSSKRLAIRVDYSETEIRVKVKALGDIWRPRRKLWEMRYEDIAALGLESRDRRVVGDEMQGAGR